MGKTKGNMVWNVVRGFCIGLVAAPLLPFMLAWECATEDWWE